MYMYIHVHVVTYLYVHGINMYVPCSYTYVLFCPILSRWVGFQMEWLAYIKKTYSADAVQHGPTLGQRELVVGDDE